MAMAEFHGDFGIVPGFPFRHAFARMEGGLLRSSEQTFELYNEMISRAGLDSPHGGDQQKRQSGKELPFSHFFQPFC